MITYALEHGYEKYNFLGITGNFDPESEDYGVYQFKRGFPGTVEELVGDFILPVNKLTYGLYKKIKG
jgi:lipid II:glycine glycyltransferase (peptidoglycan interpeptide bridge formation enzyme)